MFFAKTYSTLGGGCGTMVRVVDYEPEYSGSNPAVGNLYKEQGLEILFMSSTP